MAKLRLDLHTHPYESTGIVEPNLELAARVVHAVKVSGLDGIAVTEHEDERFGYKLGEVVERYFPGQIVIIPGREVVVPEFGFCEAVELFLEDGLVFRFLAHPYHPSPHHFEVHSVPLHGIELHNSSCEDYLDHALITALGLRHDLLFLRNSDAHRLKDIGLFYNEVELADPIAKARELPSSPVDTSKSRWRRP